MVTMQDGECMEGLSVGMDTAQYFAETSTGYLLARNNFLESPILYV
jgi:hypothetical protein